MGLRSFGFGLRAFVTLSHHTLPCMRSPLSAANSHGATLGLPRGRRGRDPNMPEAKVCVCVSIYIYIYIYIYNYLYIYIYIFIYLFIYFYIYLVIYVYLYIHMCM